jgi:hypothetical protein
MNVKIFNLCLLLGWLMVLAGGVVIHPGWGIAIAGALLLLLTLASAYLAGLYDSTKAKTAAGKTGEAA